MTHHSHSHAHRDQAGTAELHAAALRQADLIAAMAIDHAAVDAVLGATEEPAALDTVDPDTAQALWTLARWFTGRPVPVPLLLAITAERLPWQSGIAVATVAGLAVLAQAHTERRTDTSAHQESDTEHRRAA